MEGYHFHFMQTLTKNFLPFSLACLQPRLPSHLHPSHKFVLVIPYTHKGEGSHTRRLGAYGIARTSLRRY
ncbi:hypothetical protein HanRHA438_Chr04g0160461 [Helianthus annuus]|uniref:Uncharacterized protein n=2 Tax=Helianthus annuus TaxID=4232 RepID=A0A9K3J591_HELAN|nr:hypothetical protein HanXRQr2_Chr04g0150681 [Helianthus annuus]KAJ0579965.1 hypothetical protein HanHA300_Chr04g0123891 [Helianthus annuus]KAJ0595879.1 hypothetical protein HanHA89_Chr04g0136391 [Helianthus annuus]KAJ0756538.1 hypothetical protein HanLR1_Chr04g0128251 [Helianthus annuus]KAJ0925503.1 hypothetical protein HanRHA438_Chr04g0160461 [Helianthus annuus]